MTNFGPTGQLVYERTYSRVKPDGEREVWPETVQRVVDGNLALADERHELPNERARLIELMEDFKVIPAGRHLWASGVRGRQYLFNCHVSGWGVRPSDHFEFTFLRLMEGGGVGANYSNLHLDWYEPIEATYRVHIVCDPEHPDYEKMKAAGVLSDEYDSEWAGSFEVEDSREGWAAALVDLIETYYREDVLHHNRVYDVSRVRGEGSRLKTFGGRASGPLPFASMMREVSEVLNECSMTDGRLTGMAAMELDHAIATCVVSGGNRRSARMSIMRWNDPQIRQFINCKSASGKHWTTNISVEVDDEFFRQAKQEGSVAEDVLYKIAHGMLDNGEPGFWNSEYSNLGEPNRVQATNPCGEIALEPWENCNLGHVNLAAFVRLDGSTDVPGLVEAHRLMTRFLMRATYGDVNDVKQAAVLARNRRIGVGHLGVASYLALKGIRYADAPGTDEFRNVLLNLSRVVDDEAYRYAHALRIPVPVKKRTVAPTGTIAKMPGVSEGIHPIFAKHFIRRIRFSNVDPDQRATVEQYRAEGYLVEPCQYAPETSVVAIPTKDSLMAEVEARYGHEEADRIVQSAAEVDLDQMLAFQAMYQRFWADNAVSYTANVDPDRYDVHMVVETLLQLGPELKGATIFPEMSMAQSPYERISAADYDLYQLTQVSDGIDENCVSGACPVR